MSDVEGKPKIDPERHANEPDGEADTATIKPRRLIVLVMNCAAEEIIRYLRGHGNVRDEYDIKTVTTYAKYQSEKDIARAHATISGADVIISQNVKSIPALTNATIQSLLKPEALFIKLAFWRFDGLWPLPRRKEFGGFWYFPDEVPNISRFDDYVNYPVDRGAISERFDTEMIKFKEIDRESEFAMLPFVERHLQYEQLFSDSWHPTSLFFHAVSREILARMGLPNAIVPLADNGINRNRNRLIFNRVYEHMGITYDPNTLFIENSQVSRETFFEFSNFVKDGIDRTTSVGAMKDVFNTFKASAGLKDSLANIASAGVARQSSNSRWSHDDDAQRALSGAKHGGFSFHTALERDPWWEVDLRQRRAVRQIVVWNRDHADSRYISNAIPLRVLVAVEYGEWAELTNVVVPFGGAQTLTPLILNFGLPISFRYLRLQAQGVTHLHLDKVEIFAPYTG